MSDEDDSLEPLDPLDSDDLGDDRRRLGGGGRLSVLRRKQTRIALDPTGGAYQTYVEDARYAAGRGRYA